MHNEMENFRTWILWLSSDLCRMQDGGKNGQEALHYTTLRACTGEVLIPTSQYRGISENDRMWGRVLGKVLS